MEKSCTACTTFRHSKDIQKVFYLSLFISFALQFLSCVPQEGSHLMPILPKRVEKKFDIWAVP